MKLNSLVDDAFCEQLKCLDRDHQYQELSQALRLLPEIVADQHQGLVSYLRGKLALQEGHDDQAIQHLCAALHSSPANAASYCLLGIALVHQEQWLDARQALTKALQLQPSLAQARLPLAMVMLSLGQSQRALNLIEPLPDQPDGELRLLRAKAEVFTALDHSQAAACAATALVKDSRLPETTLLQWMNIAGGLLLNDHIEEGRCWLNALVTVTPAKAAIQNPFPRRVALMALLALALNHPYGVNTEPLILELRNLRWLSPSASEHQVWTQWFETFLHRQAAMLEDNISDRDQSRCSLLLQSICEALGSARPRDRDDGGLGFRLELLRQGCQSPIPTTHQEQLLLMLQRHSHGWSALSRVLEQCCELEDRPLRALRPELERQLDRFSQTLLFQPRLLLAHSNEDFHALALKRSQEGLLLLTRCRSRLAVLTDPLPQHSRERRHWLLLASRDLPQCFLYRVDQKRQHLEQQDCQVRIVMRDELKTGLWTDALLWADAVIVCRLPATNQVLRAIDAAHQAGLPTWYDMDDLVIDPEHGTPDLDTYGGTISPELHRGLQLDVSLFATAMRACRYVLVSTSTLARRWQSLNPDQPIEVLVNLAPSSLRSSLSPPRRMRRCPRLVVASGTKAHKQVWIEELAPALDQLLERHPLLKVDLVGHIQMPVVLRRHVNRVCCYPFSDYNAYLKRLKQADIGLVVLEPGPYTDAKSAIRWMEFSYLGLASVLSPTGTYTEILKDGIHARFARGIEEWVARVEDLLLHPKETRAMARRAQRHAKELFGPHRAKHFWQSLIDSETKPRAKEGFEDPKGSKELSRPKQPCLAAWCSKLVSPRLKQKRRKLLFLNVFFAPQSIGGATRIAQDQVHSMTQNYGSEYEITVLCTDPTPWMAGVNPDKPLVEVHQWHGARVVRLTVPSKDWSVGYNRSIENFCSQWFKWENFDLIHAHCIQVIGVGPLSVARAMRIPYAITLHDGWWLSPRQFLITVSGQPVDLVDPLGHLEYKAKCDLKPKARKSLLKRQKELQCTIADASARWAVSESFAQLHREAGVADVDVMENFWQPMSMSCPRMRRPANEPLRCCFIGGIALHKGMATLQAAVLQAEIKSPGINLTIMDSKLTEEEVVLMTWGETAVQFVAPVPMAQMNTFYMNQDVLIAPSIWPESYGLVTREALSAGLWVVASDIGALADPIRDGENGHRVPTGDAGALARVLEQLSDQHPSPQPLISFQHNSCTMHQQLDQSYRAILGI